ncbi:hypothetical protein IAT38_008001 [Cryptococcus sp. DSM 104549]
MPPRRARPTLSAAIADDIPSLTLPEVKDRLARNAALLSSPLFSQGTAPVHQSPTSPQGSHPSTFPAAGPSSPTPLHPAQQQQQPDPIRDKLVAARDALLLREQELMMEKMAVGDAKGKMVARSGKQRVLESIQQGEGSLAKNGLILPIHETLHLSQRDYANQTASALSSLSLNPTRSSSPKPRAPHRGHPAHPSHLSRGGQSSVGSLASGGDEMARAQQLARLNAFMQYKGGSDDGFDDSDDDDDDEGLDYELDDNVDGREADFRVADNRVGFDRNGMPRRRTDALGEEVDEFGEEDDEFAEGNDDYGSGAGDDPRSGAPGR